MLVFIGTEGCPGEMIDWLLGYGGVYTAYTSSRVIKVELKEIMLAA